MRRIRSGVIGAALGVAVVLGGCTSGSTAAPAPSATTGSSTSPGRAATAGSAKTTGATGSPKAGSSAAKAPTSTIKPLPAATVQHALPTKLKDTPALRTSILLTGCEKAAGGWQATGTAKNSGSAKATYQVVVFFTDKYSRVIDSSTTNFTVSAGTTDKWSASKNFTPPAGVQCVLRAVRKTA